jgi:hypothetical protein
LLVSSVFTFIELVSERAEDNLDDLIPEALGVEELETLVEVVGVLIEFETEGVALLILEEADFNAELTLVVAVFAAVFVGEDPVELVVVGLAEGIRDFISFIKGLVVELVPRVRSRSALAAASLGLALAQVSIGSFLVVEVELEEGPVVLEEPVEPVEGLVVLEEPVEPVEGLVVLEEPVEPVEGLVVDEGLEEEELL